MNSKNNIHSVGVIGLGIIGSALSKHIHLSDFDVMGFDIDDLKIEAAIANGIEATKKLANITEFSEVLITCLPSNKSLDDTVNYLIDNNCDSVKIIIDTSTLSLDCKTRNKDALNKIGITLLDCPISGTGKQAEDADIVIYASGNSSSYETVLPLIRSFSRECFYLGDFGNGTKTKLIANLLVAIHNVASAEAILLAKKTGIEMETLFNVIASGAGSSKIFELRAPMMIQREYQPATMKMSVWEKDLELIKELVDAHGTDAPLFNLTKELYKKAVDLGLDDEDTASIYEILNANSSR